MANKNLVNVDINPCKMCMPMGGVMAFKGIENSMVILHGSQGCSTYIRRHMATHYNEPVDIASSALTEQGTVYGGAENLKKGLKNMIKLYNPSTIGVMTTCLAETIGEDINRIVGEFYEEERENSKNLKIITVPTPGYGGTEAEGYYVALRKIVEQICEKTERNNSVNIICANLNPGDVRNIKSILKQFNINYILLPDVSNTLDSPHNEKYRRIPVGGTTINDIKKMAGAVATIEMGVTVEDEKSPGDYLRQSFGVPLYKCGIPIGIRNTTKFISILSKLSSKDISEELDYERGRYLDAMIDNHKYTGKARAIIYGQPELALALAKVCFENGVNVKLIALGAKNKILEEALKEEIKSQREEVLVLDDTDFDTIEKYAKEFNVNLFIGNSDGRRMASRLGIEIIRVGFPIHDRVGAQRQIITGYNGSAFLIDSISNAMIKITESKFRKDAFNNYYLESVEKMKADNMKEEKTCTHPCFGDNAHKFARMHIPVAPKCNISCNYCSRRYDCVNESRPGVTSEVLEPEAALSKFKFVKSKLPNLTVVGIAGPGDALANFDKVKETFRLIRKEDTEITFCLSTNGLMLPFYANEIVDLGVSHVTVTINAVDKKIGGKIYREVNYLGKRYTGEEGAQILLTNQLTGIKYLCSKGVVCKVNIVMLKGINDEHIKEVVKKVKECGVYMTNIMQMIPVKGSAFEDLPTVTNKELNKMRKECEIDIKQMYHCRQCRADAIGTLSEDRSIEFRNIGCSSCTSTSCRSLSEKEDKTVYKFAVSSRTGINVDEHFGHATQFYIYTYSEGKVRFLEKRNAEKYCNGEDECYEDGERISKIVKVVSDCSAVLALRAGLEPKRKLKEKGIEVIEMYETINNGVKMAAEKLLKNNVVVSD
ncbi:MULTISPECIES: nitrogenase cofactor biosynthesis protein NifB [Clostridium]|uniref:FeMo cofactor biosynthesis protein NifB n=1 Tax=Clostridium acetobutylicum (strain ATCC 824 / DSM 792 / JCM 1419 / IAM 19013 / LMG 5710 / NBRC 13948 / NRRL B-527 / VKM B-1787 / 2291 / W) TaxID=272562 RepID=Q97MD9_CLOAB|nr:MULTISPECIES: nitrogenase cofactor biosynthesis protein NifB [Clostridium]AAK78240.1 Fusion nifN/K+nifB (nifN-nitrogenase iron molybdenum cofactor biosinthesis protein, nifK-nitrogenase molibdenum-iron protein beta chain, nifB-nitrogenase iron-molibdenum cofactor biosynthesis protein) [Clostridium acetobutylicum ATCC 824]ADZ19306.1 Fusion nifN/K+nifB (nifN-nitrogenase iron molybdenum cofactor biosinthesis protein, nifK-nitrogenase molybdenum-iron protein beta chain, nifB-nitrogenase iron-molyb